MNLLSEVSPVDGSLHQENLTLLNLLAAASNQTVLIALLGARLVTGDNLLLLVSSGSSTKAFIVMNPTLKQLTVVIGGMDSFFSQASLVLQSWADTDTPGTGQFCYQNAANFIASQVSITAPGGYQSLRIIGHSYGGATAPWLPSFLQSNLASGALIQVYTYGAPKPWPSAADVTVPGTFNRRVFQNLDPVPSLPVSPSDVGSLWAYVGVPLARKWGKWSHNYSGLTFDGTGGMRVADNAAIAGSPTLFFTSLVSWLTSINCFAADAHSLASYTNAVNIVRPAPRPTSAPQTERVRRAPDPTVAEVTRQRDEELAVIAMNTATNPRDAATGIQSGIPLVPGVRYRGIVVGGVNWVYYGDTPVIPTRTRRTRRALVRYLNRSL
jgi:hypothetical protein